MTATSQSTLVCLLYYVICIILFSIWVYLRLGPHWLRVKYELVLLIVVVVLETDDYKAHYYYNTITHSETNLYGTINISLN